MRRYVCAVVAVGLLLGITASTGQAEPLFNQWTLSAGGHYTGLNDYTRKVGEYNLGLEEGMGEFGLAYLLATDRGLLVDIDGNFYDRRNILGHAKYRRGTTMAIDVDFRSMTFREGQDLLTNIEAREEINGNPGGKMMGHEVLDPGADYNTHRREVLTRIKHAITRSGDIRFLAQHRSLWREGTTQMTSTSHCITCHVESETCTRDEQSHQIEGGFEADVSEMMTVGAEVGYRRYESKSNAINREYDIAGFPPAANPGRDVEFPSRLLFSDTVLPVFVLPETEKLSGKVNVRGRFSQATSLSASLGYNTTENINQDLTASSWFGHANLATRLSRKTRLIARFTGRRVENDDPFIDIRTFREGRPGPQPSFDFTRYSTLDRRDGRGEVEVIHRLSREATIDVTGGVRVLDWSSFPDTLEGGTATTVFGEGKLRYRPSRRFTGSIRYRAAATDEPFTTSRGILEPRLKETLVRNFEDGETVHRFLYYYEREQFRTVGATTEPTLAQEVELSASIRPSPRLNLTLSLLAEFDVNNDIDTFDVERTSLRPHLNVNFLPTERVAFSGGWTLNQMTSQGPIAVALFDG